MKAKEVLEELKKLGNPGYQKIILNHGATEPCFGVKIADMKTVQKKTGMDYSLALELYDSGVYDAMYFAGLITDDSRMTRNDLQKWVAQANPPLAGSTISWVAAGSPHGWELALEWVESKKEMVASTGWATLTSLVSIKPDAELDLARLKKLLSQVQKTIHSAPNDTRKKMNGFVIAVGCYVAPLTELALAAGRKIGPVTVDVGNTACEIPAASEAIGKVAARGSIGKKRKTAKC